MASLAPSPRFRAFTAGSKTSAPHPLVGGKLYTYAAGTTTPKATFTTSAGNIPNANPVVLDARGEANVWLGTGSYKFVLTDSKGVQQGGPVDNIKSIDQWFAEAGGLIDDLREEIGGKSLVTQGAGQVGFNPQLLYPFGTLGYEMLQNVRPEWFGAKGDSDGTVGTGTDDADAFREAVRFAAPAGAVAKSTGGKLVLTRGKAYRIDSPVLMPSFLQVDGNNASLVGNSPAESGNTVLCTASYVGGVLTSNAGNYVNARLTGTKIRDLTISNAGLGVLLTSFGEGCELSNIQFYNCFHAIDADFSFYDGVSHCMARGSSTSWAYRFRNFANVQTLQHVFSVGNHTGFVIDSKAYALTMLSCGAEQGVDGVVLLDEAHGLTIMESYFEALTGIAIDLGLADRKTGVNIDGNFFDYVHTLVRGRSVNNFVWGEANERGANCVPGTIELLTDITLPPGSGASTGVWRSRAGELVKIGNARAQLPPYLSFNSPMDIDANLTLVSSQAGIAEPVMVKFALNTGIAPYTASGSRGFVPGTVAGGVVSFSGGTTFDIYVDTDLSWYGDYDWIDFRFDIGDNVGTYKIFGRAWGKDPADMDIRSPAITPVNKLVSLLPNGGKVRIKIGAFTHPTGQAAITGRYEI